MNVIKDGNKLIIELVEEENEVVEHLTETRGSLYIKNQLEVWLRGRFDTVREELNIELNKTDPPITIKELRKRVKDKKDQNG